MNYRKHYDLLMIKSVNRKLSSEQEYIERHHIKMRSEGGGDNIENIALLTGREHYIAHLLLYKENPNSYVRAEAIRMMCDIDPSENKNRYKPNSKVIEKVRKAASKLKSILYKQKCWMKKDNEQIFINKTEIDDYIKLGWKRGKLYSPSVETRERLRQSRLNEAPRGKEFNEKMSRVVSTRYKTHPESWIKNEKTRKKIGDISRNRWQSEGYKEKYFNNVIKKREIITCPHCNKSGVYIIMKRWHFDKCKHKK